MNDKQCPNCKQWLPLNLFAKGRPQCLQCRRELRRKPGSKVVPRGLPQWVKDEVHKRNCTLSDYKTYYSKYGLEYHEALALYDKGCQVCGKQYTDNAVLDDRMCIDHDHATGEVRGCLCGRCNKVLGKMNDDLNLLHNMAEYLVRHGERSIKMVEQRSQNDPLWEMNYCPVEEKYLVYHRNGLGDDDHYIAVSTWTDAVQLRDLLRAAYGEVAYDSDYVRRLVSRSERWPSIPERAKEFARHWRIPGVLPDEQTTFSRYERFEISV